MPDIYRTIAVCVLVLLAGCEQSDSTGSNAHAVSEIQPDETVIFFRTAGWFDDEAREWHLPVHGWIYEPEDSFARKAAFEKILEETFDLSVTEQNEGNFARRLNLLIADNERGKRIVVNLAGRNHELPASAQNGHFEQTIVISEAEAAAHAKGGLIHYAAVTGAGESRRFAGTVRLLQPGGLSVISDIDDTVKISRVGDRKALLEHTFLLDFAAAPGMAQRYREWSADVSGFHFVSSSPWQLYGPLAEFLDQNRFPWAAFSLKAVRFRDETLLDLFKEGTETKPLAIERILDRYPGRQFVLVGDNGEQDPEVYAALMRSRPGQVVRIFIRNVTGERADDERYTSAFGGIDPTRWQLFEDPNDLALPGDS